MMHGGPRRACAHSVVGPVALEALPAWVPGMAEQFNPKSLLNSFLQKHTKRPIAKGDIAYTVAKYGEQHQATVALICLGGIQFAGEVAANAKIAEQNAAVAALAHHGVHAAAMPVAPPAAKQMPQNPYGAWGMPQQMQHPMQQQQQKQPKQLMATPHANPKSELNQFCQKKLQKMITKDDITFAVQKYGNQFQATVTLACMGGLAFAGEVAAQSKQAEQNAAAAAVAHHAGEIATLKTAPPAPKGQKRKAADAGLPGAPPATNAGTNMMTLNSALSKILKRPLTKEDIKCQTLKIDEGCQTTISLPGMPTEWAQLAWAGEVGQNEKQTKEYAAAHVLAAIQSDETFAAIMLEKKAKKPPAAKAGAVPGANRGITPPKLSTTAPNKSVTPPTLRTKNGVTPPGAVRATGAKPELTFKSKLNVALGRVLKRPLKKEDSTYTSAKVDEGFQSTLSLPGMSGDWGRNGWAGEVASTDKVAQENAAKQALAALQADATYGPMVNEPAAKKAKVAKTDASSVGITRPKPAVIANA
mmetsp:Transcript_22469/g.57344  ORF Transcript_22469/g.57344 Transcript_22469/m.57344 type:complete len:529 (+) Transcript_22469:3-1589(+)